MDVDTIIIGTGQAGVPLATKLIEQGQRVLIAERSTPGGTCVNYGCTPTKTLIASARAAHVARTAARLGIHTGEVRVDFAEVMARKDRIVRQWQEGIERRLSTAGDRLSFVAGHARFVGPREIEVAHQRHRADRVVINVGARPVIPPITGLEDVPFVDNRGVMELDGLPAHLLVIGGGYVGCEFAQLFRRLGSEVTVIDSAPHLLAREDPEISTELEKVFRAEGLQLRLGATIREVRAGPQILLEDAEPVRGTHLLVATGRRPNTDDLGCEAAGVRLDSRGFVVVDERYRSSAEGVYAVGDAIAQPQFTHTAWDDHRLLLRELQGEPGRGRSERLIPHVTFTDPQVAGVGLSEREAKDSGTAYEAATMPFGEIARAIEVDERAGLLKVLVDPQSERVLGAQIIGAEAGELIHIFVALMQAGGSARALVEAQMVHPAFAEGVQSVLRRLARFGSA